MTRGIPFVLIAAFVLAAATSCSGAKQEAAIVATLRNDDQARPERVLATENRATPESRPVPAGCPTLEDRLAVFEVDGVDGLRPRNVAVYVPEEYQRTSKQYPTLYVHDGQYAIRGELKVDEAVDQLTQEGRIEPHLIVAIDRTPDRSKELKPRGRHALGPSFERYAMLLTQFIQPKVNRCFRTRTDRSSTKALGYSLGGLANMQFALQHPEVFGAIGSMSPSLWWKRRHTIRQLRRFRGPLPDRVWLDAGTLEGRPWETVPYFIQDIREARDILESKGLEMGQSLGYLEAEGEGHSGPSAGRRMKGVLAFLLGPSRLEMPVTRSKLHVFDAELSRDRRSTTWSFTQEFSGLVHMTVPSSWCRIAPTDPSVVSTDRLGNLRARRVGQTRVRAECRGSVAESIVRVRRTKPRHRRTGRRG